MLHLARTVQALDDVSQKKYWNIVMLLCEFAVISFGTLGTVHFWALHETRNKGYQAEVVKHNRAPTQTNKDNERQLIFNNLSNAFVGQSTSHPAVLH